MTVGEAYCAEIIKLLFSMTFTGSIISLVLFFLKPVMKGKLPQSFQYYMWLSAVTALLLPLSRIIVIPKTDASAVSPLHDIARQISDVVSEKLANPAFVMRPTFLPGTAVILYAIWQSGMILVLGFHILCYVSYVRKLSRHNISADQKERGLAVRLSGKKKALRLYKNAMVNTPILIGFFRPAVILPDRKYEDVKLRNILLHEMTHKKRHDIFIKWLLILAGAVHWFNPLVYFMRREMNKACELACDEFVIKGFDRNEMQQYGDTLIAVAADSVRKIPLLIAMFEDKKNLKERLGAIMKHKRYSKRTVIAASVILATVMCVIFGICALFSAQDGYAYMDKYSLEDKMQIKESELGRALYHYDKENIDSAIVHLQYSDDGEITRVYTYITGREKNPDTEMLSGIIAFISEDLGLDISNISLDYIDAETLTLRASVGE